jgi:hypothetical protein
MKTMFDFESVHHRGHCYFLVDSHITCVAGEVDDPLLRIEILQHMVLDLKARLRDSFFSRGEFWT